MEPPRTILVCTPRRTLARIDGTWAAVPLKGEGGELDNEMLSKADVVGRDRRIFWRGRVQPIDEATAEELRRDGFEKFVATAPDTSARRTEEPDETRPVVATAAEARLQGSFAELESQISVLLDVVIALKERVDALESEKAAV